MRLPSPGVAPSCESWSGPFPNPFPIRASWNGCKLDRQRSDEMRASARFSAMILLPLPTPLPTDSRMIEEMAWLSQIFAHRRRCRSYRRHRTDWSCGCYRRAGADRRDWGHGSLRSRDGHRHCGHGRGQRELGDRCLCGREPRRRRRRIRRRHPNHRRQRVQPPGHVSLGRLGRSFSERDDESSRLDLRVLPVEREQHRLGALRAQLNPAESCPVVAALEPPSRSRSERDRSP